MSGMKIRGGQIKDHQIEDKHINGKLTEAVLDIDHASHAPEILDTKMVVDLVQQNDINVSAGAAEFTFLTNAAPAQNADSKGVVLNQYKVNIRDAATGEPITYTNLGSGVDERPVYGVITVGVPAGGENYSYTVAIKAQKPDGTVVNANIAAATTVDITYPRRFSLQDVDEMFAANEKFVDGAADVTAHLNIRQLASEIFGSSYVMNNLGDLEDPFGNGNTFVEEMIRLTSGETNTGEHASEIIDEVVAARGATATLSARLTEIVTKIDTDVQAVRTDLATSGPGKGAYMVRAEDGSDAVAGLGLTVSNRTVQHVLDGIYNKLVNDMTTHKNNLASTAAGKGASLIGIQDAAGNFTGTTVEAVTAELYNKIVADVTAEVTARQNADNALSDRATDLETEIGAARGSEASLDARLDVSLNNDGTLIEFQRMHKHHYFSKAVSGSGQTDVVFTFPGGNQFDIPKAPAVDKYSITINGVKQAPVGAYTITIENTNDLRIAFDEALFDADVVGIEATIHGVTQL